MTNVIQLSERVSRLYGSDAVTWLDTITPELATTWLRANRNNRPVRRRHVSFLASEILAGHWQMNGQAIIISDDEQVLDGQHRLLAIIEAGRQVQSMIVFGISKEAFKTIDTGAVRTPADALSLHFPDISLSTVRAAATAVAWCKRLEVGRLKWVSKVSNTDTIEYLIKHPSLVQCIERLQSYPHETRPLSVGSGGALFEFFARKSSDIAEDFMRKLYTGENIDQNDVEWQLRAALIRDAQSRTKLRADDKLRMVCKGWNHRRRALPTASPRTIALRPDDSPEVKLL